MCLKTEKISDNYDGTIVALKLCSNSLSGTLPSEGFKLPHLQALDLHDNTMMHFSFVEISYAIKLERLTLDSAKTSNLDRMQATVNDRYLHMVDHGPMNPS